MTYFYSKPIRFIKRNRRLAHASAERRVRIMAQLRAAIEAAR